MELDRNTTPMGRDRSTSPTTPILPTIRIAAILPQAPLGLRTIGIPSMAVVTADDRSTTLMASILSASLTPPTVSTMENTMMLQRAPPVLHTTIGIPSIAVATAGDRSTTRVAGIRRARPITPALSMLKDVMMLPRVPEMLRTAIGLPIIAVVLVLMVLVTLKLARGAGPMTTAAVVAAAAATSVKGGTKSTTTVRATTTTVTTGLLRSRSQVITVSTTTTTVYLLVEVTAAAAAAAEEAGTAAGVAAALHLLELEMIKPPRSTLPQRLGIPRPAAITDEATTAMSTWRVIEARTTSARHRHRSIVDAITITTAALPAAVDRGLMVGVGTRPTKVIVADMIARRAAAMSTKTFVLDREMAWKRTMRVCSRAAVMRKVLLIEAGAAAVAAAAAGTTPWKEAVRPNTQVASGKKRRTEMMRSALPARGREAALTRKNTAKTYLAVTAPVAPATTTTTTTAATTTTITIIITTPGRALMTADTQATRALLRIGVAFAGRTTLALLVVAEPL